MPVAMPMLPDNKLGREGGLCLVGAELALCRQPLDGEKRA